MNFRVFIVKKKNKHIHVTSIVSMLTARVDELPQPLRPLNGIGESQT
jgi:hypothetical protein